VTLARCLAEQRKCLEYLRGGDGDWGCAVKITRFRDIPLFTEAGSWECDFDLHRGLRWIDQQVEECGLDLFPDFQRLHVWTEEQQVAWLEFFLRGGKTGRVFYFNHPGWMTTFEGDMVLVDGKQRIQAIRRFINNEIRVFGSLFSEYTDSPRLIVITLKMNVNNLKTRADVLRWYIEMNAGGTPHTEEEIEKAMRLLDLEAQ